MAESLEDYLRRLLQQAQTPPPRVERHPPPQAPVLEAELIELEPEPGPSAAEPQPRASRPSLDTAPPGGGERFASHVHDIFDRSLVAADSAVQGAETAASKSLAEELADMLRSSDGMRKAFVLSEILQRPEHRW